MPVFGDPAILRAHGATLLSSEDGITVRNWSFKTTHHPILSEDEITDLISNVVTGQGQSVQAGSGSIIANGNHLQLPEILFGNNHMEVFSESNGIQFQFDAVGSLRNWVARHASGEAEVPKVAEAAVWAEHAERDAGFKREEYDWTFGSRFEGKTSSLQGDTFRAEESDEEKKGADGRRGGEEEEEEEEPLPCSSADPPRQRWAPAREGGIDWALLRARDPILYYDETTFYEDDLHDFGVSHCSAKVRVMPRCWFLLLRHWVRVDRRLLRVWDVRLYHEFGSADVFRECKLAESTFERLSELGHPVEAQFYQDPNTFFDKLEIKETRHEKLTLGQSATLETL
mmetsp:Transcript_12162/g.19557  ORF Transcript_12162/g.19557 Transcript_12162/m.19557 type:complete len:342 (-) Transcript_12162:466-1491(-)